MKKQDARNLLNSMLIPFSEHAENIKANGTLTSAEEDKLLQIVIDFEAQSEAYNLQGALAYIASVMKRYVKQAQSSRGKKIPPNPDNLPFLIKQVLFFIMVSCIAYELPYTQKGILGVLENQHGINISHNFFSRMKTTPTQYWSMINYHQPELPINYQGQKHEELAVAIKNLVYQAGKYDVFCDVFGGSGAALLSVDRRKDSKYVYNELHRCIYNLFVVMADRKKHKELVKKLEQVQVYLRDGGDWPEDYIDIEQELKKYYDSTSSHPTDREVALDGDQDTNYDTSDIWSYMQRLRGLVNSIPSSSPFEYEGHVYTKQELLNDIFPNNPGLSFISFCKNTKLIITFYYKHGFNIIPIYKCPSVVGEYYSVMDKMNKNLSVEDSLECFKQYRFYEYYLYFVEGVRKVLGRINPDNYVTYAVAEIFNQFLTVQGIPSKSAIRGMLDESNTKRKTDTKNSNTDKFLESFFGNIIPNVHKYLRGTICHRMDCRDLINRYRSDSEQSGTRYSNPLFYVDSPYEGTKGYVDEANGISEFTPADMRELITTLRDSGDKFIFSCRAVKSKKKGIADKKTRAANQAIFDNVFDVFNKEFVKKGRPLWVLAIENGVPATIKKDDTLAYLMKQNEVVELMICNFKIVDFGSYKNTKFKKYDYADFLDIWHTNAHI